MIKDQIRTFERLVQQEAELKNTFSTKKGMVVNLPAYQKQMGEIETLLGELVAQLPDSSEVPRLLIDITEAGKQRGLEFWYSIRLKIFRANSTHCCPFESKCLVRITSLLDLSVIYQHFPVL